MTVAAYRHPDAARYPFEPATLELLRQGISEQEATSHKSPHALIRYLFDRVMGYQFPGSSLYDIRYHLERPSSEWKSHLISRNDLSSGDLVIANEKKELASALHIAVYVRSSNNFGGFLHILKNCRRVALVSSQYFFNYYEQKIPLERPLKPAFDLPVDVCHKIRPETPRVPHVILYILFLGYFDAQSPFLNRIEATRLQMNFVRASNIFISNLHHFEKLKRNYALFRNADRISCSTNLAFNKNQFSSITLVQSKQTNTKVSSCTIEEVEDLPPLEQSIARIRKVLRHMDASTSSPFKKYMLEILNCGTYDKEAKIGKAPESITDFTALDYVCRGALGAKAFPTESPSLDSLAKDKSWNTVDIPPDQFQEGDVLYKESEGGTTRTASAVAMVFSASAKPPSALLISERAGYPSLVAIDKFFKMHTRAVTAAD